MHTNLLYGVRVSDKEAALAKAYFGGLALRPVVREHAEWLIAFCRDFPVK